MFGKAVARGRDEAKEKFDPLLQEVKERFDPFTLIGLGVGLVRDDGD